MKKQDKESLDADVVIACHQCGNSDSIMYFRNDGKDVSISWSGCGEDLINGVLTCMEEFPELYEIFDCAMACYEELHPDVLEEEVQ